MIKKFFVTLIACSAFLVSCKNDDDSRIDKETKGLLANQDPDNYFI